jgi:hypothetical protein
MTQIERRTIIALSAGALMSSLTPIAVAAAINPAPVGKPGDFDFLTGEWRIRNKFREGEKWIEFSAEATVVGILGGIASVEELRIPARGFSGMGLRLLDVEKKIWSDHFVNAKSGVVAVPGQLGVFEDGAGTFLSEGEGGADGNGSPELYRGVWDRITPKSCRWFQGTSRDGGRTWDDNWFMDWTRVG